MRSDKDLLNIVDALICEEMEVRIREDDGRIIVKAGKPGDEGLTLVGGDLRAVLNQFCELADI